MIYVSNLQSAIDAYYAAKNRREEQAAYHEILLFGGVDGYRTEPRLIVWVVRKLRQLAYWIEQNAIDR